MNLLVIMWLHNMAEDSVDYYRIHDEDQTHYQLYTNVSYSLKCH